MGFQIVIRLFEQSLISSLLGCLMIKPVFDSLGIVSVALVLCLAANVAQNSAAQQADRHFHAPKANPCIE